MLSNWKKSASADKAQSRGSKHRTNIGEEAAKRRSKRGLTPGPESHLCELCRVLSACTVWDIPPLLSFYPTDGSEGGGACSSIVYSALGRTRPLGSARRRSGGLHE